MGMKFRPPLKQSIRASVLAQELMAGRKLPEARADVKARYAVDMDTKARKESAAAQGPDRPVKDVAARKDHRAPALAADLEGPVKTAISELLSKHPRVALAWRQNSGMAWSQVKAKEVPVWFYRILTGQPVTLPDFLGYMKDGRPIAIEAKRGNWKAPHTDHERKQALFLMMVRNLGGVAGFATSVEQAKEIIDGRAT